MEMASFSGSNLEMGVCFEVGNGVFKMFGNRLGFLMAKPPVVKKGLLQNRICDVRRKSPMKLKVGINSKKGCINLDYHFDFVGGSADLQCGMELFSLSNSESRRLQRSNN